ncbi:DUF4260 domain-containing protein [Methylocystis parvus OBBP]|uniref:DUF4260 family protein n=2 Tax=Methylocystis parvus TaxID=134 RepID=A0A6B8M7U5_9HYPH|nr:DUF4260 domain-containing protein [Methylocystis parvus]QGM97689.1 DUF4260 family protein [Methylocystis parvus]WBJ98376.1 DUF4260 domain-containing protein [Methylocystis parvus OBBP]
MTDETTGFVSGWPRLVLRLEGAALMAAALFCYARLGGGWGFFALLFLVPDLSLLAYLAGPRPGALLYNLAHTTIGPLAYGSLGFALGQPLLLQLAAIHLAHIGFDRALGFGLKYGAAFSQTHLGLVGRPRA